MNTDAIRDLAVRAARAAGAELQARQGRVSGLESKSTATDPVSDADRAAEELLVAMLLDARPSDAILGEEGADREGSSGVRWILDPLDGTVNYLYGMPDYAVSVACEDDAGVLVGVVHDPMHDETFVAVRGGGATLNGTVLRVNDPVPLGKALVATGFSYDSDHRRRQGAVVARVLPQVRDIRRAGSAAIDLCWVGAGRLDGYYEDSTSVWDWAAGALIAVEAGARAGRLEGPDEHVGVLAAGPALYEPLLATIDAARD